MPGSGVYNNCKTFSLLPAAKHPINALLKATIFFYEFNFQAWRIYPIINHKNARSEKNVKNTYQKMIDPNEICQILILKKLRQKTAQFILLLLF